MQTIQYEAVKVALKQDRTGFVLTLNIHPDDAPETLLRDFVGARYQVVMVRLNGEEKPMMREQEHGRDPVRMAGILCRDQSFAKFLLESGSIFDDDEVTVVAWVKEHLGVESRSELKSNPEAARKLWAIKEEYELWKQSA